MHSEYCPLCLLSYEPLPEIEEKEKNQLKKLSNVELELVEKWDRWLV
jgi:hypothetical protein